MSEVTDQAMQKLVDAIEKASPLLWHAAYRQVFVELAEQAFAIAVLVFCARILIRIRKKAMTPADENHYAANADDPVPLLCAVGAAICGVAIFVLCICVLDYSLNPTFVAIKELKGLL